MAAVGRRDLRNVRVFRYDDDGRIKKSGTHVGELSIDIGHTRVRLQGQFRRVVMAIDEALIGHERLAAPSR
jgi:hypothetical protein